MNLAELSGDVYVQHPIESKSCKFLYVTGNGLNILLTKELLQPQNTFSSIRLDGLVFANPGSSSTPVTLDRKHIPSKLIHPIIQDASGTKVAHLYVGSSDMPGRPPSLLPPSPQLCLQATVGEFLGEGRSSVVFALDNVNIPGLGSDVVVPPLVAKVSRPYRVSWVAREAWFYDEMECLQGSVVPRHFGYFERDMGVALDRMPGHGPYIKAFQDHPPDEDASDDGEDLRDLHEPLHEMLAERLARRDILSITILERLGDMLPLGQHVDDATE